MKCIKCKADNPEGKNYCGDCGAPLDPSADPIKEFIDVKGEAFVILTIANNSCSSFKNNKHTSFYIKI